MSRALVALTFGALRDTVQNVLHAVYRRTLTGAAGAGRCEVDGGERTEQGVGVGGQRPNEQWIGHVASRRAPRTPVDVAAGGERAGGVDLDTIRVCAALWIRTRVEAEAGVDRIASPHVDP